jgi:hypothetical protein
MGWSMEAGMLLRWLIVILLVLLLVITDYGAEPMKVVQADLTQDVAIKIIIPLMPIRKVNPG